VNRLEKILAKAMQEEWGSFIPNTPHRLSLGIDSLYRSQGKFWRKDATELESILRQNPGVSAQFNVHDDNVIAYAIWRKRQLVKDT
jgi:hypothetical protein